MFAKMFKKNRSFDPSELARLPELEASAQLALLDRYLVYRKDHDLCDTPDIDRAELTALMLPVPAGVPAPMDQRSDSF